ncbi:right-handed parallel beta-helix repeat-containing protein [Sediminicola luteus]|uniref:Right-handed parallel beta-helix repeat-containing protein n=1 Tax=Sediminicola luteus TaxID=319238 RepID=A0ABV2TYY5_9FLAO
MKSIVHTLLIVLTVVFTSSCQKDGDLLAEILINEERTDIEDISITPDTPDSEDNISTPNQPDVEINNKPGATYCGPYNASEPLVLSGINDTIISGLDISNPTGHAITLVNCKNVIIEKSYLHHSIGNGVNLTSCENIEIRNVRMEAVASGVYAQISQGVLVTHIEVKNALGPFPRGQMVQFNGVTGEGNKINYNVSENIMGQSNPEDAINLYNTHGTISSPIEVIGNWIRGGGPSNSGGGIMTGDKGGSHIVVKDNILVDPGQYGIAIAAGSNIKILNNFVYAKQQTFTNVGIYIWNQYTETSVCSSNEIRDNSVNWVNKNGTQNSVWNKGNCGTVIGWDNNIWAADIDSTILPSQILIDCTL